MERPQRPGGRVLLVGLVLIALLVGGGIAYSVLGKSSGHTSSSSSAAAGAAASSASVPESTVIAPTADKTIVGSGSVLAVAFSGDRKTFADLMSDGTVQLRDATTGTVLGTFDAGVTTSQSASLAFSPDGKTLAVSTESVHGVQLWNVAERKRTITIPINGSIDAVAYSPDGSTIAVAAGDDLVLVNTKTLSPLYIPAPVGGDPQYQGNALMVAYSGDGKTLAIANNEGLIQLWNVSEAAFTKSITALAPARAGYYGNDNSAGVDAIALNENGTSVAAVGTYGYIRGSVSGGTESDTFPGVWLINTKTGKQQALTPDYPSEDAAELSVSEPDTAPGQGTVKVVAFSPTADLLATGDDQGDWQLWNGATGQSLQERYSQSAAQIGAIAFSADGRTLATVQSTYNSDTTSEEQAAASNESLIELWHIYQQPGSSPTCAAHGSTAANPVLAYATSTTVELRCGSGSPTALDTELPTSAGTDLGQLAWSWDGTQLAWLDTSRINVADVATGAVRTWACVECTGLAFLGDQAVTVTQQAAGGELTAAETQLVEYPASGFGSPTTLSLTGIPQPTPPDNTDTDFMLLSAVSADAVVVGYGSAGGSDLGGNQLLYRVGQDGKATQYGNATLTQTSTGPGTIFGALSNATVASTGSSLALEESTRGGACGGVSTALLVNTATGAISTPKEPSTGGGTGGFWIEGLWYDASGTPYISLVPNGSYCSSETDTPGTQPIFPTSANPTVCKLVNGTWTVVGSGTFQASYGPGGWQAEQDGTIANSAEQTTLKVSHGSTASYSLPGVSSFAWAPAR